MLREEERERERRKKREIMFTKESLFFVNQPPSRRESLEIGGRKQTGRKIDKIIEKFQLENVGKPNGKSFQQIKISTKNT
jgi:hypothetical protein